MGQIQLELFIQTKKLELSLECEYSGKKLHLVRLLSENLYLVTRRNTTNAVTIQFYTS